MEPPQKGKLYLQCCGDSFNCDSIQHVLRIIDGIRNEYNDFGGARFRLNGKELDISKSKQSTFAQIRKILNQSPVQEALGKMKKKGLQLEIKN